MIFASRKRPSGAGIFRSLLVHRDEVPQPQKQAGAREHVRPPPRHRLPGLLGEAGPGEQRPEETGGAFFAPFSRSENREPPPRWNSQPTKPSPKIPQTTAASMKRPPTRTALSQNCPTATWSFCASRTAANALRCSTPLSATSPRAPRTSSPAASPRALTPASGGSATGTKRHFVKLTTLDDITETSFNNIRQPLKTLCQAWKKCYNTGR